MDKGSSLQKLYAIFEELKKNLEVYTSKYQYAEMDKIAEINSKDSCSVEEIKQNQKTIKEINDELATIIEQANESIPKCFPPIYSTSLKIMLNERNFADPIIKSANELTFYYIRHFEDEKDYYISVINKLNELNEIILNIKSIIKEIEAMPNVADEMNIFQPQSSRIPFKFKGNYLYIGDYKLSFRKGSLNWCLLKAIFKHRADADGANATEILEYEDYSESLSREANEKEKHKYLAARKRINKRITKKTGIEDEFVLVNNTNYSINKEFGS